MDEETLRGMASVSGGRYLHASEYRRGALGIEIPEGTRAVRREIALWNHPALYAGIVGLLVSEWFVRKRRGLA
jgi:hypothetical protein